MLSPTEFCVNLWSLVLDELITPIPQQAKNAGDSEPRLQHSSFADWGFGQLSFISGCVPGEDNRLYKQ